MNQQDKEQYLQNIDDNFTLIEEQYGFDSRKRIYTELNKTLRTNFQRMESILKREVRDLDLLANIAYFLIGFK